MAEPADFHGYTFEAEFSLFSDEFEEAPGVYIIYTSKACLDMGTTENFKESIETHLNTREWVSLSEGEDIYVAFYYEEDPEVREEIVSHLRNKMHPLINL